MVESCHQAGAKVGIQIAHAGRKAQDAKLPVSASVIPYDQHSKVPHALTEEEIKRIIEKFQKAVKRAVHAGVDLVEIHGAHGYLIHQFQSRYTNHRTDKYGEDLSLFGKEVLESVKPELPSEMPLFMRISAVEYVDQGYGLEESLAFSEVYKNAGVDVFHISSGGEGPIGSSGRPGSQAAYQVPFARAFKQKFQMPIVAVGKLSDANVANAVIANESADLVAIGRGMLRDPYWSLNASVQLGKETTIPKQYELGFPRKK